MNYIEIKKEIEQSIVDYSMNKNASNRDKLSDAVYNGFHFIDDNFILHPSYSGKKEDVSLVMDELLPLIVEANTMLPSGSKMPIGDLDYNGTSFLEYLPKSYLAYYPEKVLKAKQVKVLFDITKPYTINPYNEDMQKVFYNWLGDDDLRPVMKGINIDKYGATGTNAHILLHIAGKVQEGIADGIYMTNRDVLKREKEIKSTLEDSSAFVSINPIIEGKYPQYSLVSNINKSELFSNVDAKLMYQVCRIVNDLHIKPKTTNKIILKHGDKKIAFNSTFLEQNFKTWCELGVEKVGLYNSLDDYQKRGMLIIEKGKHTEFVNQDELTYSLTMPVIFGMDSGLVNLIEIIDEDTIDVIAGFSPAYRFKKDSEEPKKAITKTENNTPKPKENDFKTIIDDLKEAMEFMSGNDKKRTQELINDLIEASEFMTDDVVENKIEESKVDEIPEKFEYDGQPLTRNSAYLMTEEEYKEKVVPLIKSYKKFVKKNDAYLKHLGYGYGLDYYTFEEHMSDLSKFQRKDMMGRSLEKQARSDLSYKFAQNPKDQFNEKFDMKTPANVIAENKEYHEKLNQYFTKDQLRYMGKDSDKTNKTNVRYAIDEDIYRKLLDAEKISVEKVMEIAESVGVKLPKKVYDTKTQINMELAEQRAKILKGLSANNLEQMRLITERIKDKLKPIEQEVYTTEYNRIETLLSEAIGKTYYLSLDDAFLRKSTIYALSNIIPIYSSIVSLEKTGKTKSELYRRGRIDKVVNVPEYKVVGFKENYAKTLSYYVSDYVRNLKVKLLGAIYQDFSRITSDIKSFDFVELTRDAQGFQGLFKITFTNGAILYYKTQSIGAGGYNIQKFHYRYLTDFDLKSSKDENGGLFKSMIEVYKMK